MSGLDVGKFKVLLALCGIKAGGGGSGGGITDAPSDGNVYGRKNAAWALLSSLFVSSTSAGVANGVATLDGTGKIPTSQLPASVIGGLNYQGIWNASTNTPTLLAGTGTKGFYFKTSVAGTTNIDGNSSWNVGDVIAFNGSTWDKFDGTSTEVVSVNGQTGIVSITLANIGAATVASTGAYGDLSGKPTLATVAGTGAYSDLSGKPTLATVATSGNYVDLNGKPSIPAAPSVMGASGPGHVAGYAPDPGSVAGALKYLREDATWQVPPAASAPVVMGPSGSGHGAGYAPDPGAVQAAIRFLREDATWVAAQRQGMLDLRDFLTVNGVAVADDLALTNAFAAMTTQSKGLYIPGNTGTSTVDGLKAYKITTANHIWNCDAGDVYCEPTVIFDCSSFTTPSGWSTTVGPVLPVEPKFFVKAQGSAANASNYSLASKMKIWRGGQIKGPGVGGVASFCLGANMADAVAFGTRIIIRDTYSSAMDYGIIGSSNCYICNFYDNSFGACITAAYALCCTLGSFQATNQGENFQIIGGSVYNGSAIALQVSAADVWSKGLSHDYNSSPMVQIWYGAMVVVESAHIEWDGMTQPFFTTVADGTTGKSIVVRDTWFINTGGAQATYLANCTDPGIYVCFERCTFHGLAYGSDYTAGDSWAQGPYFGTDSTPTQTVYNVGGARVITTATLAGTTTAGATTASANNAYWLIKDSMCFFTMLITWTAATGTGNMSFTLNGGPPINKSGGDVSLNVRATGLTIATAGNLLQARILSNTAKIALAQVTIAGVSTDLAMKTSGTVEISGFYPC